MQAANLPNGNPHHSKYLFCFNPACPSPLNRMFQLHELQQNHIVSCGKWIADPNVCAELNNAKHKLASPYKEQVLFFSSPIKNLIKYYECKLDIGLKITYYYQNLKKEIISYIDNSRVAKLREIDFLTREVDGFKNLILETMQLPNYSQIQSKMDPIQYKQYLKKISIKVNMLMNSYKYNVPILKDIVFYEEAKFKELGATLRQRITSFNETLCSEVVLDGQFERLRFEDMQNVEQMLSFQKENSSEAIQKLLNWHESDYLIEKNQKISEIRCAVCKFRFEISYQFSVNKSKSDYNNILVQHLLESHFFYLTLSYSHRISKSSVIELPLSELIYLMKHYKYEHIDIYDAANTKGLKYEANSKELSVLFTSDSARTDDFQHCYCIANTPEEAAFKITQLINEVCINLKKSMRILNFKKQYLNLYNALISAYGINCKFEEKSHIPVVMKQIKNDSKSKLKRQTF